MGDHTSGSDHLLTSPRIGAALGLVGLLGIGLFLMGEAFPHFNWLFAVGAAVCAVAAIATYSLGHAEIKNRSALGYIIGAIFLVDIAAPVGVAAYAWHLTKPKPPSSVILTFDMPNPVLIGGSETLSANYSISNGGSRDFTVAGLGAAQVYLNRRSEQETDFRHEIELCDEIPISFLGRILPRMQNETMQSAKDGIMYFFHIYHPATLSHGLPTVIEAHKSGHFFATFQMEQIDVTKYDTVVVCPFVRAIGWDNVPFSAICPGFGIAGRHDATGSAEFSWQQPLVLSPPKKPSFCRRSS